MSWHSFFLSILIGLYVCNKHSQNKIAKYFFLFHFTYYPQHSNTCYKFSPIENLESKIG